MITPNMEVHEILSIALDHLQNILGPNEAISHARAELAHVAAPQDEATRKKYVADLKHKLAIKDRGLENSRSYDAILKQMEADPEVRQGMFVWAFSMIAKDAHANAVAKHFWEQAPSNTIFAAHIALMHSELSEALEGARHGNPPDQHLPAFDSVSAELADCIIRIMDNSAAYGFSVAEALVAKMAYNATRPAKHGKAY